MTDDGRRLLALLAPWLLCTNTADPQTWPAITEVCVRAALTWAGQPDEPRLQADLDTARNWLAEASRPANGRRAPRAGRRQRRWARHAIRSALLTVVASADQDDADARLRQVLVDCATECRLLAVDLRLSAADCPQHLAVEPHPVWSPGCDWMELGYRPARTPPALLSGWPDAAQAQPTRGKTEPATTHRFRSANGMRNSEARRGNGCPVLTPSPDRG
jgi:hypothetical protein